MRYLVVLLSILFILPVYAGELVRLERVSDGDTFIVSNSAGERVKLRLLWIDTPEKYVSKKLKRDALKCNVSLGRIVVLGRKASSYARQYFKDSKNIEVDFYGKGYYGRSLAVVYRRGADMSYNFDVVRNGYACIYRKAKYPKVLKEYLKQAKEQKKGLWGIDYELMECLCN